MSGLSKMDELPLFHNLLLQIVLKIQLNWIHTRDPWVPWRRGIRPHGFTMIPPEPLHPNLCWQHCNPAAEGLLLLLKLRLARKLQNWGGLGGKEVLLRPANVSTAAGVPTWTRTRHPSGAAGRCFKGRRGGGRGDPPASPLWAEGGDPGENIDIDKGIS